jgi:chromate transporter
MLVDADAGRVEEPGRMTEIPATADIPRRTPHHGVTLAEAFRVWLRVAALSFGGPAGQIAVMHRIIVDEKRWVGESRFLHALSYCMLLPGPEAHQLAIYIGWLMHRWPGAMVAGGLFVLPGIISIMALSYVYAAFGSVPVIAALFLGLKAAVLAIVLQAVQRVGSRALKSKPMLVLAVLAFIGIFFLAVPFPLIVIAAGVVGFIGARAGSSAYQVGGDHGGGGQSTADEGLLGAELPEHAQPTVARALRVSALWLALWLGPVLVVAAALGGSNVFTDIGAFFSKMAVVTFGGAYAVLAYMAQQAVETYGWLKPGEMLDGLGMAETTPGPLIMVVQFVGFLAAYRTPGALPPMLAGTLGGLLATWCTFIPCFLWIGLGAPFIERLRDNKPLSGALAGITAAVVGVILNLAIWFALHTWFRGAHRVKGFGFSFDVPVLSSLDPWALLLSLAAMIAIFRFKVGMIQTLLACSAAGLLLHLAGAF